MIVHASTPIELIRGVYQRLAEGVAEGRRRFGRPLTAAEKILIGHLHDPAEAQIVRGVSYEDLRPDRVAMQDATAQMAWLQFMVAGLPEVAVPTTVHCDHLISAREDGRRDLLAALENHEEVYDFLASASARYGAGFWKPGSGIIHQVVLENYAFPGGLMIGTDSHTPNAGGLGMVAVGVGGADAVDVMTGFPWNVRWPRLIGVHLTGGLSGWAAPKDVILKVAERLTVSGGTGAIVEYFGPGAESISCTGKATICNMGAEIGATTSLFAYDEAMARYLKSTNREAAADAAEEHRAHLQPDPEVSADPDRFFDSILEIDLSALGPQINGPHTPDRARPVAELGAEAAVEGWPMEISAALVGSCTNSSYEDITRAASILSDAAAKGLKVRAPLMITPGSEQIRATIARDGLLETFEEAGAVVLANACGPCIGQWSRSDVSEGTPNVIVTSYNRNFPKRNDGLASTLAFVTSPEVVVSLALAGRLDFDPVNGSLANPAGENVRLAEPIGTELPPDGFDPGADGFAAPPTEGRETLNVHIPPASERLQKLTPFAPLDADDFADMPVLLKAAGKCTTDHISAAGPWLRYRGHLENISGNLFAGAVNAFTGSVGAGKDQTDGQNRPFPEIARRYHEAGWSWAVIGDHNYGEGSSREHAAMEPRYRGCTAVIVRSFARIAETNLKKQGILPLTFTNPDDYELIGEDDRITIKGLTELAPGKPMRVEVTRPDGGGTTTIETAHTLSKNQIDWLHAGSALNHIRSQL